MMMEVMHQAAYTSTIFTDCFSRNARPCFMASKHIT
jgi:hypothetical protein